MAKGKIVHYVARLEYIVGEYGVTFTHEMALPAGRKPYAALHRYLMDFYGEGHCEHEAGSGYYLYNSGEVAVKVRSLEEKNPSDPEARIIAELGDAVTAMILATGSGDPAKIKAASKASGKTLERNRREIAWAKTYSLERNPAR